MKRIGFMGMVAALCVSTAPVMAAPSGEITVWSWDVAAKALQSTVAGFNKKYPDVKVKVEDLGNQIAYDRGLAGCAAGGANMPDVYSVENGEAEVFWARFPECFAALNKMEGADALLKKFPEFKLTELQVEGNTYAMPWDSGPVVIFYRRDYFQDAGVDPASIKTWDDYIAAGKKIVEKTGGKVKMAATAPGGDDDYFRDIAGQSGCGYFDPKGTHVTINQPGCVKALEIVKKLYDANIMGTGGWAEQIQFFKAGAVATSMFGGWYEGQFRTEAPDQKGKWGVMRVPAVEAGGNRAANLGGSALAIPAASKNQEAAWAFVSYALGTVEGQITMLKEFGLVPSLLDALNDPYVKAPQEYWGGQAVWTDVLATLPDIKPVRGTQFFQEAREVSIKTNADFLAGKYKTAKEALDAAATQISGATGLPIAK